MLVSIVFTKNLTLHDYDNPSASHILDIEVTEDDILIVSGMLGGIEFYDISSSETLNHLDNLQLSSGGGGGGIKPNCIISAGDYAYVTTNQGLRIINISNTKADCVVIKVIVFEWKRFCVSTKPFYIRCFSKFFLVQI